MKRFLISGIALVVLSSFMIGCADMSHSGAPCDKCNSGYVTVGKRSERRYWCDIDGKHYDCTYNPGECPNCKGMKDMK